MKKEKKTSTIKKYKSLKGTKACLYLSTYTMPLIPASIMAGVNWDTWLEQCSNKGSLGLGFGSLLVSILITLLGVVKRDKIAQSVISPFFTYAGIMALWGVSLVFLSDIAYNFGVMLLFSCLGLIGSATADQVNKNYVSKEIAFYEELIKENGLGKVENKKREKREQAKRDAEIERLNRQASE